MQLSHLWFYWTIGLQVTTNYENDSRAEAAGLLCHAEGQVLSWELCKVPCKMILLIYIDLNAGIDRYEIGQIYSKQEIHNCSFLPIPRRISIWVYFPLGPSKSSTLIDMAAIISLKFRCIKKTQNCVSQQKWNSVEIHVVELSSN